MFPVFSRDSGCLAARRGFWRSEQRWQHRYCGHGPGRTTGAPVESRRERKSSRSLQAGGNEKQQDGDWGAGHGHGRKMVQFNEVRSGDSYLSQNDPRLHFGLGSVAKMDRSGNPLAQWRSRNSKRCAGGFYLHDCRGEGNSAERWRCLLCRCPEIVSIFRSTSSIRRDAFRLRPSAPLVCRDCVVASPNCDPISAPRQQAQVCPLQLLRGESTLCRPIAGLLRAGNVTFDEVGLRSCLVCVAGQLERATLR